MYIFSRFMRGYVLPQSGKCKSTFEAHLIVLSNVLTLANKD
jgi:hypothetical protein